MASESDGSDYSLTEIFAIKFVLADILIIAVLLLGGPLYALAITALFVLSTFLIWYLTQRTGTEPDRTHEADSSSPSRAGSERDPVTKLQNRYAAGELSESEFEEKLERLIDANERAEAAGVDTAELSLERTS
ncbi:SHOCT domain-containing protein [Halopiger djelfimassiliensis]|uniref:SHOCT domain-containing protein n=1 Tax=Halopiger djelfimassiliensis TaxID=1293047 RepID=UPI000677E76F|nr:SHOCT domain-containing protein [Halopiger djelfimassiliensis]